MQNIWCRSLLILCLLLQSLSVHMNFAHSVVLLVLVFLVTSITFNSYTLFTSSLTEFCDSGGEGFHRDTHSELCVACRRIQINPYLSQRPPCKMSYTESEKKIKCEIALNSLAKKNSWKEHWKSSTKIKNWWIGHHESEKRL